MKLHHSIQYSIINQKNLPFTLNFYVEQNLVATVNHDCSITNTVCIFDYDYKHSNNCLKILSFGQEQSQKLFQLHKINIESHDINVLSGLYETESTDWWKTLDEEQLANARQKVLSHGGNFGWFGTVSYYYDLQSKQLSKNSSESSIASLFRTKIRL